MQHFFRGNQEIVHCRKYVIVFKCTFLARHLMPLDKNPRLRSIGFDEVLLRIAAKMIVVHAKDNVVASMGSLQVCTGHEAGCESLIHAMRTNYKEHSAEALCLGDPSNAFNSANRNVFLHNVKIIFPSIAWYGKNCHSFGNQLFIIGNGEI